MNTRMKSPVLIIPEAYQALIAVQAATKKSGVPERTLNLINLRASQINGCSFCVEMHSRDMKKTGETDERIWAVAAWRESPHFTDPERAALALTEAATRIADRPDAVPDEIWEKAAQHYDPPALSGILLQIGLINVWNRLNVATRQPAGPLPRER